MLTKTPWAPLWTVAMSCFFAGIGAPSSSHETVRKRIVVRTVRGVERPKTMAKPYLALIMPATLKRTVSRRRDVRFWG
jgi:hypothetical protein